MTETPGDADNENPERTAGGQPIIRSTDRRDLGAPAMVSEEVEAAREAHLTKHLGEEFHILHEVLSSGIHLDVHVFAPTDRIPYLTLVTSGMSDLPMSVPAGLESRSRLELMLGLPSDWPGLSPVGRDNTDDDTATGTGTGTGTSAADGQIDQGPLGDERNYWPIRLLKDLARLPHDYATWLSWGHSIPNGDPAQPYAEEVPFTGAIIGPPLGYPVELMRAETALGRINYLAVLPVTSAEMEFKISSPQGADELIDRMAAARVTAVVDPGRRDLS
ncbi:suppressor of fused domain protein [Propionibacteriaceae bacterium Y2011]